MPQNVLVSVLGEGKYLTALVRAILEKNIIPTRLDRKSTRLNSSHSGESRMPSSA